MPRYDYECKRCGIFEVHQNIDSKELDHCPTCYDLVIKLVSIPAFLNTGTRGELVKRQKDIINYVDKKQQHGTHPNMKQAMMDYGKLTKTKAVLQR